MRKITKDSVNAFLNGNPFKSNNTNVVVEEENKAVCLLLHDNLIAKKFYDGSIEISNAGWFSSTTKERLNGLPNVKIKQRAGVWYLNDVAWDGDWIEI